MKKNSSGWMIAASALVIAWVLMATGCGEDSGAAWPDQGQTPELDLQKNYQTALQTKISKSGRPASTSASGTAAFKFSCNLGTCAYKCSLDSSAWKTCKSPKTYKNIAEGSHTFKVKAYYSGQSDHSPALYTWLIQFPGSWVATSTTNAPTARYFHTAVWTGSEMIIWGGDAGVETNTGAKYDPTANSWIPTSTTGAPAIRSYHTAIWTGSNMVVWGGTKYDILTPTYYNTGGRYDPAANTWTATNTANAPAGRYQHQAIWTGSLMMVWGGDAGLSYFNTGGKYDPTANSWTAITTTNAPDARDTFTAVWDTANSQMIVWGGIRGSDGACVNSGGRYNPTGNSWQATPTANAPAARFFHTAVWDTVNSQMIVWGGECSNSSFNSGGRYLPSGNSWSPVSLTNGPAARNSHTAVWAATEMIVWGGQSEINIFNSGARYNPVSNTWINTSTVNAPGARFGQTAVWTDTQMIIWGGSLTGTGETNTGGRFTP